MADGFGTLDVRYFPYFSGEWSKLGFGDGSSCANGSEPSNYFDGKESLQGE